MVQRLGLAGHKNASYALLAQLGLLALHFVLESARLYFYPKQGVFDPACTPCRWSIYDGRPPYRRTPCTAALSVTWDFWPQLPCWPPAAAPRASATPCPASPKGHPATPKSRAGPPRSSPWLPPTRWPPTRATRCSRPAARPWMRPSRCRWC